MADLLIQTEVPGLSAVVHQVVTGGPDGNEATTIVFADGVPTEAPADKTAEPDVTLTVPVEDAKKLAAGELALAVPFMQGRLKAEGDMAALFALLAAARGA